VAVVGLGMEMRLLTAAQVEVALLMAQQMVLQTLGLVVVVQGLQVVLAVV
jgi:hypothetical protein